MKMFVYELNLYEVSEIKEKTISVTETQRYYSDYSGVWLPVSMFGKNNSILEKSEIFKVHKTVRALRYFSLKQEDISKIKIKFADALLGIINEDKEILFKRETTYNNLKVVI